MSSVYPSHGGMQTLPCQRCNAPLFPNDPYCKNCGFYNAPVQGNNAVQNGPSSNTSWAAPAAQDAYRQGQGPYDSAPWNQAPAPGNFVPPAPQQMGLRNFFGPTSAPPANNGYPGQPISPTAGTPSSLFAARPPYGTPPGQPAFTAPPTQTQPGGPSTGPMGQPPSGSDRVGGPMPYSPAQSMPMGQQGYPAYSEPGRITSGSQSGSFHQYGATQGPITGAPSFGPPPNAFAQSGVYPPTALNQSGVYPQNALNQSGVYPPTAVPQTTDFKKESAQQGRPKTRMIILVVILLIVVVGGSIGGYIFLSKRNSAQVTPTLTGTITQPKGAPIFTDTFKDNKNGWNLQSYPGKFAVTVDTGSLVLEDDNNELLWDLLPGGKTYGDFTLMVDATLSKGELNNGYGIYIRGASNQNTDLATYYRFEFYGDGSYAIFKGTVDASGNPGSSKLVDYTLNPAMQKQGGINHISITAKGSSMSLAVNGKHLTTITDSSYVSGSIAFFVSNLQNARPGAQAKFSNLSMYAV